MPQRRRPMSLKEACVASVVQHVDTYWLESPLARQALDEFYAHVRCRYLISPFDHLDDQTCACVLRALYKNNRLTRYHLLMFVQWRARTLDLSFIRKKNLITQHFAYYVGRNCLNLVELNLFAQVDLNSKHICYMLQHLRQLKKIDISHTKANLDVFKMLASNCRKLEKIYADNCPAVYDACLDEICKGLQATIQEISLDNVRQIGRQAVVHTLRSCPHLRHFYVNQLIEMMHQEEEECLVVVVDENNNYTNASNEFKLTKFIIDPEIALNEEKMQTLVRIAPELRELKINCISANANLAYLSRFRCLNDLLLANTNSLISFCFGGVFLDALRTSTLGKQLRTLHLIHLVDVNLRSIARHCTNLVKLNVEMLGYYAPAHDNSLGNDHIYSIKSLQHLSVSNVRTKHDQIATNMGEFRLDLSGLICTGSLKHLSLGCLSELDDAFFECLFISEPLLTAVEQSVRCHVEYAYESIETIELREMNAITGRMLSLYLLERVNCLKELVVHACKLVGRGDLKRFNSLIVAKNLDCKITWT